MNFVGVFVLRNACIDDMSNVATNPLRAIQWNANKTAFAVKVRCLCAVLAHWLRPPVVRAAA